MSHLIKHKDKDVFLMLSREDEDQIVHEIEKAYISSKEVFNDVLKMNWFSDIVKKAGYKASDFIIVDLTWKPSKYNLLE